MRGALLLVAGFVLAGGSISHAGDPPGKEVEITFDGYCDGMKIAHAGWYTTSLQTGDCLGGVVVMGLGYRGGKFKNGFGKLTGYLTLGVNWEAYDGHKAGSEQHAYLIQYPLVTGGFWSEQVTYGGDGIAFLASGTYTVVGEGAKGPTGPTPTFMEVPHK